MVNLLNTDTMKNLSPFLIFAILICIGCKDDDTPVVDPVKERLELLAKTWEPNTGSAVTVDGIDVSSEFAGFTLTFTDSFSYSTTNVGPNFTDVWPDSGIWSFAINSDGSSNINVIERDGISITINSINTSSLRFSFDFLTASASGNAGIDGSYVFDLGSK